MSRFKPPYLQPYRGNATRLECPSCGKKNSFSVYLNGDTQEPIHPTVGICNHAGSCRYHYTPRQYFLDHPELRSYTKGNHLSRSNTHFSNHLFAPEPEISPALPPGTIPFSYVDKSASYRSHFVRFLCELMTEEQIRWIGENYALGATRKSEVIFWQIDITGKVRTGKIMQYNPDTGKRIKHESGAIDWVHNKLKYSGKLPKDFNLKQCFFGEHLLKIYPDKTVAIAESEKNAVMASVYFPELVWLSCGNLNGLSVEKCKVLKGKNVILFPDLKVYDIWSAKAPEIEKQCCCKIQVSNLLESIATEEELSNGYDIADFIIRQLQEKQSGENQILISELTSASAYSSASASISTPTSVLAFNPELAGKDQPILILQALPELALPMENPKFSQKLSEFIEMNPAVAYLMDSLSLEEVNGIID